MHNQPKTGAGAPAKPPRPTWIRGSDCVINYYHVAVIRRSGSWPSLIEFLGPTGARLGTAELDAGLDLATIIGGCDLDLTGAV